MVEYLDANHLLNVNHHGSRHSHNTATALIQMYDQWVDEMEDGKMVGIMMIDLSAAFDMVNHQLLVKKLRLFGFEEEVVNWLDSYLSGRTQSVYIDGCMSPPLNLSCGVPQGSILGPLLYILFTNDIPDLVHDHQISFAAPTPFCESCGSIVCYVDDATYSHGDKDPETLSSSLTDQYNKISKYMAANKLVINDDKTQLVVMGHKKTEALREQVTLQAGQHTIQPSSTAKLLGATVSQDAKWKFHILEGEQSQIRQLTSRVNGLCLISGRAPFKTRLMVANGIVTSKLCYLIQLWGGCENYLLHALQVLQNKAARAVTQTSWFTSTRQLLLRCNWLSVKQLVFYQSALMTHKIVTTGSPHYLANKMGTSPPYGTRQDTSGGIRFGEIFSSRHSLSYNSFVYRATTDYNSLPDNIRSISNLSSFKYKLCQWVKSNIPIT